MTKLLTITMFLFASKLSAQNVGIGTNTPVYPLSVVATGPGISQESSDGSTRVGFYTTPGSAYVQTHTNHNLFFATNNGSPQMTLTTAGNIGIGTLSPNFLLDVNGRARLRYNGATSGIWYNKQDNSSPASFVGQVNNSAFGIFDNASLSWKFAFDHVNGYAGIGTITPKFPLTFPDAIGDKISLWGGNASSTAQHYGLGIQGGLMQLYTNASVADIAFGYGNSNAFNENVRMKGDGNMNFANAIWTSPANDRVIRFGDADFVHIGEVGQDDQMELKAGHFLFKNGKVQIQDGSQGTDKVLVSDANGTGTWTTLKQPFTNVERFKLAGVNAISLGGGSYVADFNNVLYNYSSNIVIDLAANTVTFNKAGLYRFEFDIRNTSLFSNVTVFGYLEINGVSEYVHSLPLLKTGASTNYEGALNFATDRYMPAGTVLRITIFSSNSTFAENYLSGYLIAE